MTRQIDVAAEVRQELERFSEKLGPDLLERTAGALVLGIRTSALGQEAIQPTLALVDRALQGTERFRDALKTLKERLERLDLRSRDWWRRRREAIASELARDLEAGGRLFVESLVDALLEGDAAAGEELVGRGLQLPERLAELDRLAPPALERLATGSGPAGPALDLASRLLALPPELAGPGAAQRRPELLVLRGRLHLHDLGDAAAAGRDLEEAQRLASQHPLPLVALGELCRHRGERERAVANFRQALLMRPGEPQAHAGLGLCAEDEGHWEDASHAYDRAAELVEAERDPVATLARLRAPLSGLALVCLGQRLARTDEALARDLEEGLVRGQRVSAWQAAEACLLLSFATPDPSKQLRQAEYGLRLWDRAAALALPQEAWPYLSRARLVAQEFWVLEGKAGAEQQRYQLLAEAVAFTERSLLRDASQKLGWGMLSSLLRELRLDRCARLAGDRAAELYGDEQDPWVTENRIICLTNLGDVDAIGRLLSGAYAPETNRWGLLVSGFMSLWTGRHAEAVQTLERGLSKDPDPPAWALEGYARARELAGDASGARETWQRLVDGGDGRPPTQVPAESRGLALAKLGRCEEAIERLRPLLASPFVRADAARSLALCWLALGRADLAREEAERVLAWSRTQELRSWLEEDLRAPSLRAVAEPAVLTELEARALARLQGPEPTPEQEAQQAIAALAPGQAGSWLPVALHATLARVALGAGDAEAAARAYQALQELPERAGLAPFPEARAGFGEALEVALAQADEAFTAGRLPEAAGRLEALAGLAAPLEDPVPLSEIEARLGYTCFERGDRDGARRHLAVALGHAARSVAGPGVGTVVRRLLPGLARFFALRREWEDWAGTIDSGLRGGLAASMEEVGRYLDETFLAPAKPEEPFVRAVVLDLASELIPADTSAERWAFLGSDVPRIRSQIEQERGIAIPGVRLRDAGPSGRPRFRVVVNGEVVLDETVPPADPPFEVIGVRLHDVLLRHLGEIVGLDEVSVMLERWGEDPGLAARIASALPGLAERVRFTRVVRALLAEQVPLVEPAAILQALGGAGMAEDPVECSGRIRLALCRRLPGIGEPGRHLPLPAELESALDVWTWHEQRPQGSSLTYLAAPPSQVQAWLEQLGALLAMAPGLPVVVADRSTTRALLRRLGAADFPDVPTLSREELAAAAAPPSRAEG